MSEETTTEQLAEIEGQAEDTPATEYTPPEGWRVVRFGEQLLPGDVWVNHDGTEQRSNILHWDAAAVSGGRCIRRIKPEQPVPVQVREGRWRTRGGDIRNVTPTPAHDSRAKRWPWRDAAYDQTWTANGRNQFNYEESPSDLVEYLGPIESQAEPEPESDTALQAQVAFLKGREVTLGTRLQQEREVTTRLRGDLELVQKLLGTEKRRVAQLEDLVGSLRTINETQEKAFEAAGKENTALRNQLAAVASVAADRQRLLIELDAAQQVPADSPELRQLRADLEQMTRERDEYRYAHDVLVKDANTVHERTKAMTVEAIAEWLEPIRAVDSEHLANETLQHLPKIMRHLTGLDSHAID